MKYWNEKPSRLRKPTPLPTLHRVDHKKIADFIIAAIFVAVLLANACGVFE